ncbi:MAG: hypothetical protein JXA60_00645 [Candidatus Coatesbacteria bacterium]|nr:hypothetical protein [Candidatus Coatesbacteria bacterium]
MKEQGNLQALLEELNKQGIEKGEEQANKIISEANAKAGKILEDANKKADEIVKFAEKKAEDTEKAFNENLELAARDFIKKLKLSIENDLFKPSISRQVGNVLSDSSLLKKVIFNLSRSFMDPSITKNDIALFVNKEEGDELAKEIASEIVQKLARGVVIKPLSENETGFRLGIENENFTWDFTEDSLIKVFTPYLLPKFRKIIYKEEK